VPELNQLQGTPIDLMKHGIRPQKSQTEAEKRYSEVQQLHDELKTFIERASVNAPSRAHPAKATDTRREVDTRFKMNLDDGVMINSAALWCLWNPSGTSPKPGGQNYATSRVKGLRLAHLAARYFPKDEKCQEDPSCCPRVFLKYHQAKAYEWELRLQDEIGPDSALMRKTLIPSVRLLKSIPIE